MHDTAEAIGAAFLRTFSDTGDVIVELGSHNVNGSLRLFAHPGSTYIGFDIGAGPGVDVVMKQDEPLPIASGSVDIVIATSVFEHDSFFWQTFLEMLRILKPGGVVYINAPSNGSFHRFPTDNWRFYPDAGKMLEKWGVRNGHDVRLIESFLAARSSDQWNDFVAIFQRGPVSKAHKFISEGFACMNVWRIGAEDILHLRESSEDMTLIASLQDRLRLTQEVLDLKGRLPGSGSRREDDNEIVRQRRLIEYLRLTGLDTRASTEHLERLLATREHRN